MWIWSILSVRLGILIFLNCVCWVWFLGHSKCWHSALTRSTTSLQRSIHWAACWWLSFQPYGRSLEPLQIHCWGHIVKFVNVVDVLLALSSGISSSLRLSPIWKFGWFLVLQKGWQGLNHDLPDHGILSNRTWNDSKVESAMIDKVFHSVSLAKYERIRTEIRWTI